MNDQASWEQKPEEYEDNKGGKLKYMILRLVFAESLIDSTKLHIRLVKEFIKPPRRVPDFEIFPNLDRKVENTTHDYIQFIDNLTHR